MRRRFMKQKKTGVFILNDDFKLYTKDNFTGNGNTVIGICLITDKVSLLIHKANFNITLYWSNVNDAVLVNGVTTTTKSNEANNDYRGVQNTLAITTAINTQDAAAVVCKNNVFPLGIAGYLGSCGEWKEVIKNKKEINELLLLVGGITIEDTSYWTSTQHSIIAAWVVNVYTGSSQSFTKTYKFKVRQFGEIPNNVTFAL